MLYTQLTSCFFSVCAGTSRNRRPLYPLFISLLSWFRCSCVCALCVYHYYYDDGGGYGVRAAAAASSISVASFTVTTLSLRSWLCHWLYATCRGKDLHSHTSLVSHDEPLKGGVAFKGSVVGRKAASLGCIRIYIYKWGKVRSITYYV